MNTKEYAEKNGITLKEAYAKTGNTHWNHPVLEDDIETIVLKDEVVEVTPEVETPDIKVKLELPPIKKDSNLYDQEGLSPKEVLGYKMLGVKYKKG